MVIDAFVIATIFGREPGYEEFDEGFIKDRNRRLVHCVNYFFIKIATRIAFRAKMREHLIVL